MKFPPIVARELRVTARRPSCYWIRAALALGATGIGVFLYLANLDAAPQFLGKHIFSGLAVLAMLFCLYAGRHLTADCLSHEKREGTLGLLFLTDLKGHDVVLGKLSATSLSGFYSLLAILPVLALTLLLGGVTSGEFWRVAIVLANTFLFSLAVGMFASSLTRQSRWTLGLNLLLMVFIVGLPAACFAVLGLWLPAHRFFPQLLLSCPFYSLYLCSHLVYYLQRPAFWWSVGIIHGLSWLLLGAASWIVPHCWQDKPRQNARLTGFIQRRAVTASAGYRKRLLNRNPFYWLAARSRFKPLLVWGVLAFIGAWWLWATWQFGTLWLTESNSGTNLAVIVMFNVALKLWVPLEASRQLAEDRHAGSFELLLSTPLTAREIFQGQWLALRRLFLWPAMFGYAVAIVFMLVATQHSPADQRDIVTAWLCGLFVFALDVTALVWTAMYAALITNSPNHATLVAATRILIAPSVLLLAIIVLTRAAFSSEPTAHFEAYLLWWVGLSVAADLIYGLTARRRLINGFRELACSSRPTRTPEKAR
jgi:ABC-type Na+ efflux pump permease subunit